MEVLSNNKNVIYISSSICIFCDGLYEVHRENVKNGFSLLSFSNSEVNRGINS